MFTVALLWVGVLLEQETWARNFSLPEGALARLGKGHIQEVAYSPDGTRLALPAASASGCTMSRPVPKSS